MPSLQASLIAIPEGSISTLHGLYDVLNAFEMLAGFDEAIPAAAPFRAEIVAAQAGTVKLASGLAAQAHRGVADAGEPDIVIVPSVLLRSGGWQPGRYPQLVEWIARAHKRGAQLCSACSGVFLLAETGLFDGRDATIHWSYVSARRVDVLARPRAVSHRAPRRPHGRAGRG